MSSSFTELGVPRAIADSLAQRGIAAPFPIQAAALPLALAGRDVCGRAPTGSGKTIAFGIPLVVRCGSGRPRRPRGLVLVPTRELAAQVTQELILLAGPKGPSIASFYGGVGFGPQIRALRKGLDIAVACPGRLTDLAERGEVDLSDVSIVVIDEADRMADMGFLPQVRKLLDQIRGHHQTMLFSATLDGDAAALTRRYQTDPVTVEAAPIVQESSSRHVFWWADGSERTALTAQLVTAHWPAVVFCRTKRGADRLTDKLNQAGVDAAAIHGDRSQAQRERALASFIAGNVQALVATDIAARGIHVDDVACVVNFDPAEDEKAYVHRSGRTGRAGASGLVVSLVSSAQAVDIKKMQAKLNLPRAIDRPEMTGIAASATGTFRPSRAATGESARRSVRSHSPAARPGRAAANRNPAPGRSQHGADRGGKSNRYGPPRRSGRG
ncbi:MAG: DEAD/DEAH box helicase [Actinomycetota bacterium]|nr:DEAD/DEAH box helicase [Actinomycetota bacterium]